MLTTGGLFLLSDVTLKNSTTLNYVCDSFSCNCIGKILTENFLFFYKTNTPAKELFFNHRGAVARGSFSAPPEATPGVR